MSAPPLVEALGVSKIFPGRGIIRRGPAVHAVRDVHLRIARGEAVGVVGESGSGKSTLGRLLIGLLPPSAGDVRFDGQSLRGLPRPAWRALRRRMQIVFQDPFGSLDPRRRVGAQIADALVIHDIVPATGRTNRIADLLREVGLEPEHARRFPHEFSGGQRQRIGIARALAARPDFLVADEPVSALDVSVQAQILALLDGLRRRLGLTLLLISHDLHVVRHLCDRVIVMYLGRIMEEGPTEAVFASPAHPYTQALLSATPRLDPARRARRILLPGEPPSPADPPSGCVFRTRCPHALPSCAETVPELTEWSSGWRVACLRLGAISSAGRSAADRRQDTAPSPKAPLSGSPSSKRVAR